MWWLPTYKHDEAKERGRPADFNIRRLYVCMFRVLGLDGWARGRRIGVRLISIVSNALVASASGR